VLENIPEYLKLSTEERKAAWEAHRVARKALPEKPSYERILDLPPEAPKP
jgi:hypothetical protein